MEKKYTVLRVIATLYKIMGVLIALGTVLLVILAIVGVAAGNPALQQYGFDGGPFFAFIGVIMVFLGGGLSALGIYAVGEAIYLLIGLEENTRFTAVLLRDRFYPQPAAGQPMMPAAPVNPNYPPAV